ncbi:hypothetical protein HRR80_007777 [Exophiala dermatitidis]|uniref:Uncharacterized protein n=1 Tax=Exophiala dermatitidis TaxID=5970 RepID=A0AAN6IS39_EXODE|nr:hypothetical protein HRR77_007218 [Exophiala dermatitidis]KAJ8988363.1 hypothetical protein HRR80_007777 [Exophiala dermatitidis]
MSLPECRWIVQFIRGRRNSTVPSSSFDPKSERAGDRCRCHDTFQGRHLMGSIFGPAYSSRLLFIAYHRRIGCIPRFQKEPDHQRAMASILEKHGLKFVNPADGQEVADQLHFSHAVILPPNARTVIISGQVGILPDGSVPQSLEDEYDEAFTHVENVLRAIGFGEDALEYVFDVSATEKIDHAMLRLTVADGV